MKKVILLVLCSFIVLILAGPALADPDPEIPCVFKLQLRRVPGKYWFKFALFDRDGSNPLDPGTEVWSENMDTLGPKRAIRSKRLKHKLGSIASPSGPLSPTDFSQQLWVQAFFWKANAAAFVPCSVRMKLKVTPYALFSSTAAGVGDIAPDAVNSANIVDNSITSADIQNGTITSVDIQNGTIQAIDIGTGAIGSAQIANNSVTSADIANYNITDIDISGSANITPSKIANTAATLSFSGTQSFDSGTFRIDATNNRVGINVAPSQALDVSGSVEVSGDYRYSSSRTHYYPMANAAFVQNSDTEDWTYSQIYSCLDGSGSTYLYASVNLPQGATVTSFYCYYDDVDPDDSVTITIGLYRRGYTSTDATTMASTTTTSTGFTENINSIYDTTIENGTINNGSYQYIAQLYWNPTAWSCQLRFYGCRIAYDISTLMP